MTLEFGTEVADVLADTSNDLVIRAADIAPHRKRRTGKGHKVGVTVFKPGLSVLVVSGWRLPPNS